MVGPKRRARRPHAAFDRARRPDRAACCSRCSGPAGVGKSRLVRGVPRLGRRDGQRGARPLPAVRRGHHVLAGGRGRPRGRRRSTTIDAPEDSLPEWIRPGRRRRARGRDRAFASARSWASARASAPPRKRRGRSGGSSRLLAAERPLVVAVRGHPLGRARVPRPHRPRRRTGRATRRSCSLCTARPELLDTRPDWGGGKLNAATLLLEPLDAKSLGRADREPARRRRARPRGVRPAHGGGRGQPAVRRADARRC